MTGRGAKDFLGYFEIHDFGGIGGKKILASIFLDSLYEQLLDLGKFIDKQTNKQTNTTIQKVLLLFGVSLNWFRGFVWVSVQVQGILGV